MKCFICGKKLTTTKEHYEIPAQRKINSRSLSGWVGIDAPICICKECFIERTKEV